MTRPCVKTSWTERFVIGLAVGVLAGLDPLLVWLLGQWPLDYDAPPWLYVALWLIVIDIYIGPLPWRDDAGSTP
jgi:hypothetical protein